MVRMDVGHQKPLTVTAVYPQEEVERLTHIAVSFSEPMRPVKVTVQEAKSSPLQLLVRAGQLPPGTFQWTDPATLAYVFDEPVVLPIQINGRVVSGTQALSGAKLEKDIYFSVHMPPLKVQVRDVRKFPYSQPIFAIFSNVMLDAGVLRSLLSVSLNHKPVAFDLATGKYDSGNNDLDDLLESFSEVARSFTLRIKEPLPPDSEMVIACKEGDGSMGESRWTFPTCTLECTHWEPGQSRDRKNIEPNDVIFAVFNQPVRIKELVAGITVVPEAEPMDLEQALENPEDYSAPKLFLPYFWKPDTTYTVTVQAGLKGVHGGTIQEDVRFSFTTGKYPRRWYAEPYYNSMERNQGVLPVSLCNIPRLYVRLRYMPWKALRESLSFRFAKRSDEEQVEPADRVSYTLPRNVPTRSWGWEVSYPKVAKRLKDIFEYRHSAVSGTAETHTVLDFSTQTNVPIRKMLDLPAMLGFSPAEPVGGMLCVDTPDLWQRLNKSRPRPYWNMIQATDLAVTYKQGEDNGLVWVTTLGGGKPVAGAALTLLNPAGEDLWHGTSDHNGVAWIPGYAATVGYVLTAAAGGEETWLFLPDEDKRSYATTYDSIKWQGHLLTQLPLYQPGQTVRYTLFIARFGRHKQDWMSVPDWMPMPQVSLTLRITDSRRKELHSRQATTNAYGSVSGEFELPQSARLGNYRFSVTCSGFPGTEQGQAFQVKEFRKPDMHVALTPPSGSALMAGDATLTDEENVSVTVEAAYFSGASLSGARVTLEGTGVTSESEPYFLDGYQFGDKWGTRPTVRASIPLPSVKARLDEQGKAVLALPSVAGLFEAEACRLDLEATVADISGLTSHATTSFMYSSAALRVGLRAPRLIRMHEDVGVDIKVINRNAQPVSGIAVRLRLERRIPPRFSLLYKESETTLWERDVFIADVGGQHVPIRFERSGVYCLTAEVRDGKDRLHTTRLLLSVLGPELHRHAPAHDTIELIADKESYVAGDTATVAFSNPLVKGLALIATERLGVRRYEVRPVNEPSVSLSIPLSRDDAPYVYISVTLIRGRIDASLDSFHDDCYEAGAPRVVQGVIRLDVLAAPRLAVAITPDNAEYRPGSVATVQMKLTGEEGEGRKGQITLLAVDNRILRAAGERRWYDLKESFHSSPEYTLVNEDSRITLLFLNEALFSDARVYTYQKIRSGIWDKHEAPKSAAELPDVKNKKTREKTGKQNKPRGRNEILACDEVDALLRGLSGGEMEHEDDLYEEPWADGGDVVVREFFDPMAYWLADGETDEQGALTVSCTLPDSLSSYRLVAVATDAYRFAQGECAITVNQPLQLVSALPRFAVTGDKLEARIMIQNLSNQDGDVQVEAEATGMRLDSSSASARLDLKAGSNGVARFPVTFEAVTEAALTIRAFMGSGRDAARFILPVRSLPLTTEIVSGMLREGETRILPVTLPERRDPRSAASLLVYPFAELSLIGQEIIDYPWHCLEQRLSRAWLRALRLSRGRLIGLPSAPDDQERIRAVLRSVPSFQQEDGGFSLWPERGQSSDPYLAVYVLLVNTRVKELGMSIHTRCLANARAYLRRYLRRSGRENVIEIEALALWMLADYATQPDDKLDERFESVLTRAEGNNASPLIWAALMLANKASEAFSTSLATNRRSRIRAGLKRLAALSNRPYFESIGETAWKTMGSVLRDNALLLEALIAEYPDCPGLHALAEWIRKELRGRTVSSTQSSIFGIWGISSYLRTMSKNKDTALRSVWNTAQSMAYRFAHPADPPQSWTLSGPALDNGQLELTAVTGHPCWTFRLQYGDIDRLPQAENAGFFLRRSWVDAPRDPVTGRPAWSLGDRVQVEVRVRVPSSRHHVLLFDPFPAGLEPLYASRVDMADAAQRHQPPWKYQETRMDGMLLYAESIHPGEYVYTYTLRAAYPGVFVQRPSQVEEMYTPEVFGKTAGELVEVKADAP